MSNEAEYVKNKITKLIRLGESSNLEEAQAAMMKSSRLMEEWGLSMDDIEFMDQDIVYKEFKTGGRNRHELHSIFKILSEMCDVKYWVSSGKNFKYNVMGYEPDVILFEYFWGMLYDVFLKSYEEYKKSDVFKESRLHGRSKRNSFRNGFVGSVYDIIRDEIDSRPVMQTKSGTDLVPLKEANIESYFKDKIGITLVKKTFMTTGSRSSGASSAGSKAGANVSFRKPVEQNTSQTKLITNG